MDFSKFLVPNLGFGGVVLLMVLMVLWGKLVPRASYEDRIRDKDQQIETWREAYLKSEEARDVMRGQITELLQMARTTTHVMNAVQEVAGRSDDRAVALAETED